MRAVPFTPAIAALAVLGASGCSGDFDPYDELLGFRLLAVRATQPELRAGESTKLDALIFNPDGAAVTYRWSWCPFRAGADQNFDCFFTHDALQAQVDAKAGMHVEVPSFELGTTATVSFSHAIPPAAYRSFCAALADLPIPTTVTVPSCGSTFPVSIRLDVEAGGQKISALKQVEVQIAQMPPAAVNQNPGFGRGVLHFAATKPTTTSTVPATKGGPPLLERDTEYQLDLTIPSSAAETYTGASGPATETLAISWFHESNGDIDRRRTGYIAGEEGLDLAGRNKFKTPKKPDYPGAILHMIFVIRDNRDGVGWLSRTVQLRD